MTLNCRRGFGDDLDIRIIHAAAGEIIRTLTIDPTAAATAPADPPAAPHAPDNHDNPAPTRVRESSMSRDITWSG